MMTPDEEWEERANMSSDIGDYKDHIQAIFEEMVDAEFEGKNYWEISDQDQQRLYEKAMHEYSDRLADRADYLRKAEREGR